MAANGLDLGVNLGASMRFSPLSPAAVSAAAAGQFPSDDDEAVKRTVGDVTLLVGSKDEGVGNLLITTRRLIWLSTREQSKGFAVGYKAMVVHAVSRDVQSFDRACIYVQLDEELDGSEGEEEGEEDRDVVSELRFAPVDPDQLEDMFEMISECAALNPDSDVEDDEGDFFYNQDEVMAGVDPEQREAMLAHYDSILQGPEEDELDELVADDPDRFDDADEP